MDLSLALTSNSILHPIVEIPATEKVEKPTIVHPVVEIPVKKEETTAGSDKNGDGSKDGDKTKEIDNSKNESIEKPNEPLKSNELHTEKKQEAQMPATEQRPAESVGAKEPAKDLKVPSQQSPVIQATARPQPSGKPLQPKAPISNPSMAYGTQMPPYSYFPMYYPYPMGSGPNLMGRPIRPPTGQGSSPQARPPSSMPFTRPSPVVGGPSPRPVAGEQQQRPSPSAQKGAPGPLNVQTVRETSPVRPPVSGSSSASPSGPSPGPKPSPMRPAMSPMMMRPFQSPMGPPMRPMPGQMWPYGQIRPHSQPSMAPPASPKSTTPPQSATVVKTEPVASPVLGNQALAAPASATANQSMAVSQPRPSLPFNPYGGSFYGNPSSMSPMPYYYPYNFYAGRQPQSPYGAYIPAYSYQTIVKKERIPPTQMRTWKKHNSIVLRFPENDNAYFHFPDEYIVFDKSVAGETLFKLKCVFYLPPLNRRNRPRSQQGVVIYIETKSEELIKIFKTSQTITVRDLKEKMALPPWREVKLDYSEKRKEKIDEILLNIKPIKSSSGRRRDSKRPRSKKVSRVKKEVVAPSTENIQVEKEENSEEQKRDEPTNGPGETVDVNIDELFESGDSDSDEEMDGAMLESSDRDISVEEISHSVDAIEPVELVAGVELEVDQVISEQIPADAMDTNP